jgi:hypothetical protein
MNVCGMAALPAVVRLVGCVAPLLLLAACAPELQTVDTPGTYQTVDLPTVGSTAEAQVGDTMIDETHSLASPAIRFLGSCTYSEKHDAVGTGTVRYSIGDAAVFTQTSTKNGAAAYCGQAVMDVLGSVEVPLCVALSDNAIVAFPGSEMIVTSDCKFEHTTQSTDDADTVRKEILYDGRSGSTIRLSYREFTQDLARPAFTQELSYDIASDKIIGFRRARFEVLSAGNSSISYRLLSGF